MEKAEETMTHMEKIKAQQRSNMLSLNVHKIETMPQRWN